VADWCASSQPSAVNPKAHLHLSKKVAFRLPPAYDSSTSHLNFNLKAAIKARQADCCTVPSLDFGSASAAAGSATGRIQVWPFRPSSLPASPHPFFPHSARERTAPRPTVPGPHTRAHVWGSPFPVQTAAINRPSHANFTSVPFTGH
jgi:hypothetical protein